LSLSPREKSLTVVKIPLNTFVQVTRGFGVYRVEAVYPLPAKQVAQQLHTLVKDRIPDAIKIGMLGNADIVEEVIAFLQKLRQIDRVPVVCDTVLLSSSGACLLEEEAVALFKQALLPLCDWFTPNLPEAAHLLGLNEAAASQLQTALQEWVAVMGNGAILKGGHGVDNICRDFLITPKEVHALSHDKIQTSNLHGTGCTFASAFATFLAQGRSPTLAFEQAKLYVSRAIEAGKNLQIGQGNGPLQHFWQKNANQFK